MTTLELTLAVGGGIVGLLASPLLTRRAARRTFAQPTGAAVAEERSVLGAVLVDPARYEYMAELTEEDFFHPEHAAIWRAIVTAGDEGRRAGALDFSGIDDATVSSLTELGEREHLSRRGLIGRGTLVVIAAGDRGAYKGAAPVVETGDFDAPLQRTYVTPTRNRQVWSALASVVGGALGGWLAARGAPSALAGVLAALAVLTVVTSGVVIALVDIDTLYLDLRTFWFASALSWALAAGADLAAHHGGHLLVGLAVVVVTALLFEGSNLAYRLVRGIPGMGFGDSMILLMTAGVPAALTGTWLLGSYAVIGGLVCGVGGWVVAFVRGRLGRGPVMGRRTPFAFGPYLELGWLVAWVALVALHYPGVG